MSSNSITFSILKVNGANKKPVVDENGYYRVTLGAFNSFNSRGEFYLADGVRDLVENKSSLLYKRLEKGYLNGEMGHPVRQPGMSMEDYFNRNLRLEMSNISHHIKEIIFTPTDVNSGMPGKGTVLKVEGWVKPSGPHGELLKQALDNPDQNVAFSIRSFTEDTRVGSNVFKKVLNIVTWDWVIQPGISQANQWDSISLESYDLFSYDINDIVKKVNNLQNLGLSHEDSDIRELLLETVDKKSISVNCNDRLLKW